MPLFNSILKFNMLQVIFFSPNNIFNNFPSSPHPQVTKRLALAADSPQNRSSTSPVTHLSPQRKAYRDITEILIASSSKKQVPFQNPDSGAQKIQKPSKKSMPPNQIDYPNLKKPSKKQFKNPQKNHSKSLKST